VEALRLVAWLNRIYVDGSLLMRQSPRASRFTRQEAATGLAKTHAKVRKTPSCSRS
jgi:hypothetical protein